MIKKRLGLFSSILFFLISGRVFAQCGMFELPLSQKVENTSDIFEGKIISTNCFWNAQHSLIFTSNIIEVYKVFKGNIANAQVEIITEGGTIDDEMHGIEPNLNLSEGDIGIFMAVPSGVINPLDIQNTMSKLQCYGNVQGFFKYDLLTKTATVPFRQYNDIQNDLYQPITNLTGETYKVIKLFDINQQGTDVRYAIEKSGGSISGFNPAVITAGTNSVLTIDGSGFGAVQGSSYVNFKNADDGGMTYKKPYPVHYVSWSDTQIKVKVPSKVGTGTIQVVIGATVLTSSFTLTVSYAEANITDTINPYQTDLVNLNTLGGITWQMNTAFDSNTPAKDAFNRALQTWSSNTRINWTVGSTTSVNSIGRDSINVVRFDVGSELAAGTLARCYFYWLGCSASVWYVSELDMAVDDGTSWEFGPAAPTGALYDFETIMLHELGHGHQLRHVIDITDVMHYATSNAISKRTLNTNNTVGGSDIMSRSFVANSCGPGPMIPAIVGINNHLYNNAFIMYPNPASGSITIELAAEATNTNINVFNYLGEMVVSVSENNGSKKLNLDLSNMSDGVYCIVGNVNGKVISKNIVLVK